LESKYPFVENPDYVDRIIKREVGYMNNVYNNGIFPLYQKTGSRVDTYTCYNYVYRMNIFQKFDEFGMRLRELYIAEDDTVGHLILDELAPSQQSNHLLKLTLINNIPQPIDQMANMVVLETLIINCIENEDFDAIEPKVMNFTQF
jgi:hypothetical protein